MTAFNAGMADVVAAYTDGRFHTQRFYKSTSPSFSGNWCSSSFAAGQPSFDAHVGVPLQFTPCVASGNNAIYYPPIPAGQSRFIAGVTFRAGYSNAAYQSPQCITFYDLLGFYPQVDGESTDTQTLDNTASIQRFTSGDGVQVVMVNHVAPGTTAGTSSFSYIDHAGKPQTSPAFRVANNGLSQIVSGQSPTSTNITSPFIPLGNNARGIRSITSIQHSIAPGGLHCFMLVKPLFNMVCNFDTDRCVTEKCMICNNASNMPMIPDGTWLEWAIYKGGAAGTLNCLGDFTFIWK